MGRKIFTPFRIFFGLLGVLILLRLGLSLFVNLKIGQIRKEGLPATPKELSEWYNRMPGPNASDLYFKAFSKFPSPSPLEEATPIVGTKTNLPPVGASIPAPMLDNMNDYIGQSRDFLPLLREANAVGDCRVPLELWKGIDTTTPHLGSFRKAARILEIEALVAVEKGDNDESVRATGDILDLSCALRHEPLMISQLVRIACEAIGVSTIERVLNRTSLTKEQLIDLDGKLQRCGDPESVKNSFLGERCMGASGIRSGKDVEYALPKLNQTLRKSLVFVYQLTGLSELDAARYLTLMDEVRGIVDKPLGPASLKDLETVEDQVKTTPTVFLCTRTFFPAVKGYPIREMRASAWTRCMRVALAIERYRLDKKKLPEKLEELVPGYLQALPTDPFDGNPLRYLRKDKGYIVYGIGEDLKDDGGDDSKMRGVKPDLVIHIER